MNIAIPIASLLCEKCSSEPMENGLENATQYVKYDILFDNDNEEIITVSLDVKKISWKKIEQGVYVAIAIMSVICPCCEANRYLRYQLESPIILLTNIGICRVCSSKLSIENEEIEYIDSEKYGLLLKVKGKMICHSCIKSESKDFQASVVNHSSIINSKALDLSIDDNEYLKFTNLSHIIRTLTESNITSLEVIKKMAENQSPKYDMRGSTFGNFAETIQSGGKLQDVQHIYTLEKKQNMAEAAEEIQQLLNKLALINPNSNEAIAVAIHQEIKQNPTLKARLISALQAGGLEALKAIFDHPLFSIPAETIKGWIEAE